jgi:hypothetical protein
MIKLEKISPSSLMCYEKCPKLFYYTTILGLKLPQSMVHLEFGTAIHAAVDEIYSQRNPDGFWKEDDTADKAKEVFQKTFKEKYYDKIDDDEKAAMITKYPEMVEDGLLIIDAFWAEKEKFLTVDGIDMEEFEIIKKFTPFNPETKEPWPVMLSCRLDGLAKNDIIVEYKTSSKPYDIFETRASLQSLSYAFAKYCETGRIYTVYYIVMLKKRKKDRIQVLRIQYDKTDLLMFDAKVRSMLDAIDAHDFRAPLKGHDFFCDCRKFDELLDYKN